MGLGKTEKHWIQLNFEVFRFVEFGFKDFKWLNFGKIGLRSMNTFRVLEHGLLNVCIQI